MRNAYLETLYDLAQQDKNVYAIISDNGAIVYDKYRQDLPDQFINAGISEANMVGMAAGMARRGKIPFAYTIGAFLAYRAFEFIINDVCLQKQNVKMVGIGAGCSYSLLGASHHTIFDIAALRPLPNLTIFSPASPMEVRQVVQCAYEIKGPVYIRLGTNRESEIYDEEYAFKPGKGVVLGDGTDIAIVSTGSIVSDVLQAAKLLRERGISVRALNMHTLRPFDRGLISQTAKETRAILTVEEHNLHGGLGSIVAEVLAEDGCCSRFARMGFTNFIQGYGKHAEVKDANGLGISAIVEQAEKLLRIIN